MARISSNRSRMPSLTTSLRWMTPRTRAGSSPTCSATTRGVPPDAEIRLDDRRPARRGRARRCCRTQSPRHCRRPCGCCRPGRSMPLIRVVAVNATSSAPSGTGGVLGQPTGVDQVDDAAPLGGLVGQRGQLRRPGQLRRRRPRHREQLGRLPVAVGDGAGLVEQQHVDVAGRLDRTAGHGEHVAADEPVHARDADRAKQGADRRRDQADQQGDEHQDRRLGAASSPRTAAAWPRPARRRRSARAAGR